MAQKKLEWVTPNVKNLNPKERIESGTPSVAVTAESTAFNSVYVVQSVIGGCGSMTTGTVTKTTVSVCTLVSSYPTANTSWAPPDGNWTTNVGNCSGAASSTTITSTMTVACS